MKGETFIKLPPDINPMIAKTTWLYSMICPQDPSMQFALITLPGTAGTKSSSKTKITTLHTIFGVVGLKNSFNDILFSLPHSQISDKLSYVAILYFFKLSENFSYLLKVKLSSSEPKNIIDYVRFLV